jgi:hypothetical protein
MDDGRPIAAVGGSADTRALVPRLGWRTLGSAHSYVLPLRGTAVAQRLAARGVPATLSRWAFDVFGRRWYARRSFETPPGGRVERVNAPTDAAAAARFAPTATGPQPDPTWLRWIAAHPASGRVGTLYFQVEDELVGWSCWRVPVGARTGMILDLRTREDDARLHAWVLGETIAMLDRLHVEQVKTVVAGALLDQLMAARGFVLSGEPPVSFWPGRGTMVPVGSLEVRLDVADAALLPYPETWA